MLTVSKLFTPLFEGLTSRQKEVLVGRFGLDKSGGPQTLAALGAKYGVTRERVRQIESSALAELREKIANDTTSAEVAAKVRKFLKDSGGSAKRESLLAYANTFIDGMTENHANLFLEASRSFYRSPENKHFWTFYYLDKDSLRAVTTFVSQWTSTLRARKDETLAGKYGEHFATFIKKNDVPEDHAATFVSVTKKIGKNSYDDTGLTEWPEIHPKTVRDRIYLALKKKGEPLHFRTIAETINQMSSAARTASAPTVHNELIKDGRFVLVGRGTYALAEHGYEPGTAREVIHRILKKNGGLKPKDVMLAVQKERFFKPNTILVNLQNKSYFKRLPDGTYRVRES